MELCNAFIMIRPSRLDIELVEWRVAQLSSWQFALRGVPADVTGLEVHIGVPGTDDHYVVHCAEHPGGLWTGYASPACFPTDGSARYEGVAKDARGNETYLGSGAVTVSPRTSGNVVVATASDADGGVHTLTVVNLDGAWTLRVD
jgi:hypothetical protein